MQNIITKHVVLIESTEERINQRLWLITIAQYFQNYEYETHNITQNPNSGSFHCTAIFKPFID